MNPAVAELRSPAADFDLVQPGGGHFGAAPFPVPFEAGLRLADAEAHAVVAGFEMQFRRPLRNTAHNAMQSGAMWFIVLIHRRSEGGFTHVTVHITEPGASAGQRRHVVFDRQGITTSVPGGTHQAALPRDDDLVTVAVVVPGEQDGRLGAEIFADDREEPDDPLEQALGNSGVAQADKGFMGRQLLWPLAHGHAAGEEGMIPAEKEPAGGEQIEDGLILRPGAFSCLEEDGREQRGLGGVNDFLPFAAAAVGVWLKTIRASVLEVHGARFRAPRLHWILSRT